MTLADRITRYLLARQHRRAIRQLYETAAGAGLLESAFVEPGVEESGLVWRLPATAPGLTGNPDHDRAVVARALRHRPHPYVGSAAGGGLEDEGVRSVPKGRAEREAQAAATRAEAEAAEPSVNSALAAIGPVTFEPGAERRTMLRLIRAHLPPPPVAETAVALLLARAAGESLASFGELLAVMKRPAPVIVIRVAAHAFESRFGKMLDAGLIIPGRFHLVDGFGQYALSGAYRDNPDDRRMVTLSGKSVHERGADVIRGALMKAWSEDAPLVLADELPTSLPVRITAGADLVLTCPGIDHTLIAELMHHCAGIAPKAALSAMSAAGLDASRLGIDDLVLAIRPGRSVRQMVEALRELEAESRKVEEDEETDDDKPMSRGRKTSEKSSKSTAPRFEIIQPADLTHAHHGKASSTTTDRLLLVEEVAGYGEAKAWAMELGQDLALWREGQLGWAEMSTRLLLSGPPGTGKTTFAKALCNTLQVPLLATSVAQWLEPGYLGDVLKLMSNAFATARQHAPSILFIDEFDNIGSRGSSDRYQDYWESLINRLLELLDGTGRSEGVVVIAATNRPEKIDPALLRSGRLERHVIIPKPDTEALAGILAHHLGRDLEGVLVIGPTREEATDMSEAVAQAEDSPSFVTETGTGALPTSLDRGDRP